MPDVYLTIAEADEAVVEQLAQVLEMRAADPQQRAMLDDYLSDLVLPDHAVVLEVGCGTGAVSRTLAARAGIGRVVGVDPSPVFLDHARRLATAENLTFEQGDAQALPLDDDSFDLVVFHTVLCHVPGPDRALSEAFRVVRPGGQVVVFDGDYATTTVAIAENDPLQRCADATIERLVHDRWLVRRISTLLANAGFQPGRLRSHGYVETVDPRYTLTLADRGIDGLAADGVIDDSTAVALKGEARRRVAEGRWFGHIAYGSISGTRSR